MPRSPKTKSKEIYITTETIIKLYNDDMGRFPVRSRSGIRLLMLSYHMDTNVILVDPFESRHNRHRLAVAYRIMTCLTKRGHSADLKILENECSAAYKLHIEEKWGGGVPTRSPWCTSP